MKTEDTATITIQNLQGHFPAATWWTLGAIRAQTGGQTEVDVPMGQQGSNPEEAECLDQFVLGLNDANMGELLAPFVSPRS